MPHRRWLLGIALGCLVAQHGNAQSPTTTDMPDCSSALGGNYDVQTPQEKQNRRVRYATCWRRWALLGVGRAYGTIGRLVSGYERSLRQTTYGVIRAEADSVTRLQLAEQQSEMAELDRRYDEEARAILQPATQQNRVETDSKRAELRQRRGVETASLQQHAAENAELQASIRRAFLHADEEIARRVDDDRENRAEQHQTKLRSIDAGFGPLANAEAGQSIVEWENEREENAMTPFFESLQGLFEFVSGLIGKEDPADDPQPQPIGQLGIRG